MPEPRRAAVLLALALALDPAVPRAESVPERLARLQARIAALEASVRQPAQAAASASPEPSHSESDGSLRSQDLLRERRGEAQSELAQANAELREAESRLRERSEALSARLVALYKTRRAGSLVAFSSGRDLQSGLRLASDLGRIVEVDSRLFEEYRRQIEQRQTRAERSRALSQRVEDVELAYERQRRIDARNALELRRLRAQRTLRLAAELRGVAKQLETPPRAGSSSASGTSPRRGTLPRPIAGEVRGRFGARLIPEFEAVPRRSGIEIAAARGTPVSAVAAGRVLFADVLSGYGTLVIVEHDAGLVSVSGGLERRAVGVGERVEAGRSLGTVGDGAGLYFELRKDGAPVDPEPWFE